MKTIVQDALGQVLARLEWCHWPDKIYLVYKGFLDFSYFLTKIINYSLMTYEEILPV